MCRCQKRCQISRDHPHFWVCVERIQDRVDELTGALAYEEVDLGPPLLPKILTATIASINLKCATLTVSEQSVINHESRNLKLFFIGSQKILGH